MSQLNDIINQINQLTGYSIPATNASSASATPASGSISTANILPGQVIKADHILRIINALNGVNANDVVISGSFSTSGSNRLDGSLTLPFLEEGDYLYVSGGLVAGTQFPSVETASYATYAETASYAPEYVLNNVTGSMLAPYVLVANVGGLTVLSSSYATTASYALNAGAGAGFPYSGSAVITGSLNVTQGITGSSFDFGTNRFIFNNGLLRYNTGENFDDIVVYNDAKVNHHLIVDGDNDYVILQRESGNVGIGISAPTAKLNVSGTVLITGSLTVSGSSTFTNIGPAIFSGSVTSTTGFTGSFSGSIEGYVPNTQTSSFATTSSNSFSGNQIITGSLTVSGSSTFRNIGPAIFSGSVSSNSGFTGSFSGNGSNLTNLPSQVGGNAGEIQFNVGGAFSGVSTLTYNSGTTLVTATNIKATGVFAEYITIATLGNTAPAEPGIVTNLTITQSGTYMVTTFSTEDPGEIYFPDPTTHTGQKIRIQNRDSINTANIGVGDYGRPRDINDSPITTISTQTTKLFISSGTYWLEI